MNAAEIDRQITSIIAVLDARLRRGLISPEEHLISVGELRRWAARMWDPDTAPELTQEYFERADLYHGDMLIRRGSED
jgi:hypothetical protein